MRRMDVYKHWETFYTLTIIYLVNNIPCASDYIIVRFFHNNNNIIIAQYIPTFRLVIISEIMDLYLSIIGNILYIILGIA